MKSGPGVAALLLAGRAGLGSLAAGTRGPRPGVRLSAGCVGLRFRTHLGTGSVCPESCVGLLAGRAGAKLVRSWSQGRVWLAGSRLSLQEGESWLF